jgi:molecular chaperone Hsp33
MTDLSGAPLVQDAPEPRRDVVHPFLLEHLGVLGRLAVLGPAVDSILSRHVYPAPVALLLGETVALAAALAASVKYDGIFTLQAQGNGPVRLLVADVTSQGHLRGYAGFDSERLRLLDANAPSNPVPRLLGAGHLAFTVDQGRETERYQGIVDLAGPTLAACAQHYFRQSEQIEAVIRLAVAQQAGGWRAGAMMLQRLPQGGARKKNRRVPALDPEEREDGWRRVATRAATVRDAELTNPDMKVETLLYRLFPEDDVRLFRARPLVDRCRCSRERAAATLRMLPRDNMDEYKIDGVIVVTCQFCNRHERFDDSDLGAIFAAGQLG